MHDFFESIEPMHDCRTTLDKGINLWSQSSRKPLAPKASDCAPVIILDKKHAYAEKLPWFICNKRGENLHVTQPRNKSIQEYNKKTAYF